MKIIKQDGEAIMAHSIEMRGCKITCTPDDRPAERVVCGEYEDIFRVTEVFSEVTFVGWNFSDPEYVMPQN